MKYQIGNRVKIKPGSQFYTNMPYNPKDVEGTIVTVKSSGLAYRVDWDNGRNNSYGNEDLELIQQKEPIYNIFN